MDETKKTIESELAEMLFDFVKRVSQGEATSETEVQVLPEVAEVLRELICYR